MRHLAEDKWIIFCSARGVEACRFVVFYSTLFFPVLLFPECLQQCLEVTTAHNMDSQSPLQMFFLSLMGRENSSFSFSFITFPKLCLWQAVSFPCVFSLQYLLLSLFLPEDRSRMLSNNRYIINNTSCSMVLNRHVPRKRGYLLAEPPSLKGIRNTLVNP